MMNTLMVREHNRVCGVLKKEHPEWGDEQLFQTAKNIIGGRCMSLHHSSRYNYVHGHACDLWVNMSLCIVMLMHMLLITFSILYSPYPLFI